MIAKADPFVFHSKDKQRVSDYFKAHPTGDYDHFQGNWSRSAQVGKGLFSEVYTALQQRGAIKMIEGGKAHERLAREIEARLIKEGKLSARQAETPLEPAPAPPPLPTPSTSVQAPLTFPNAVANNQPIQEVKDITLAKDLSWKEIDPDVRTQIHKFMADRPDADVTEARRKFGINFTSGTYNYQKMLVREGRAGNKPGQHRNKKSDAVVRNGHIPFINNTPITSPQTLGFLNTEGLTPADIKFIGTRFPSIISEILAPNMTFKFFRTSEFESDGEVEKLELRRVR